MLPHAVMGAVSITCMIQELRDCISTNSTNCVAVEHISSSDTLHVQEDPFFVQHNEKAFSSRGTFALLEFSPKVE